jgi:hypothetical protein
VDITTHNSRLYLKKWAAFEQEHSCSKLRIGYGFWVSSALCSWFHKEAAGMNASSRFSVRDGLRCLWSPWIAAIVILLCQIGHILGPALFQANSSLPVREGAPRTVPLFNAWTIWWNSESAFRGFRDYWDAPIFFPAAGAFAYSEPQPATLLVAPVYWTTNSLVLAYNTYLVVSLFLNGIATFWILRSRRVNASACLLATAAMVWLPVSLRQIEVLQLIPIWPMVLLWHGMDRFCHRPSSSAGVLLAIMAAIMLGTSIHHGMFFAVCTVPAAWILVRRQSDPMFRRSLALTLTLLILIAWVCWWPLHRRLAGPEFQRTPDVVSRLSATPIELVLPPKDAWIGISRPRGFGMCPGWTKCLLALAAVVLTIRSPRRRRWTLFLASVGVVSGLLALGPNLKLGVIEPWNLLADMLPGFRQVRSVFRFSYMMQMAVILLAGSGLHTLQIWSGRWRRGAPIVRWLLFGLGIMAVLEVPPPEIRMLQVPDPERHAGWTGFVKQSTPLDTGVLTWPFAAGGRAEDFDVTAEWMFLSTAHGRPLVDGFSGFFPSSHRTLRERLRESGLDPELLQQLFEHRVSTVVARRSVPINPECLSKDRSKWRLVHCYADEAGVDVYRIQGPDETDQPGRHSP